MIIFIFYILLYLLPGFLAMALNKEHWLAIMILNVLLGWTYVGWVISLVWALADEKKGK